MVRPFAVKGRKRKRKEKYDAKSGEDEWQRDQKELKLDEEEEGRDGVSEDQSRQEDETKVEEALEGIPILLSQNGGEKRTGVTFVLERARLLKSPKSERFHLYWRFSHSSEKLVEVQDYVASVSDETPLVFVVGALVHGKIEAEYTDDFIAISNYPLSAACCINMICDGVHRHWKFI